MVLMEAAYERRRYLCVPALALGVLAMFLLAYMTTDSTRYLSRDEVALLLRE